jgi:hypothetical protein
MTSVGVATVPGAVAAPTHHRNSYTAHLTRSRPHPSEHAARNARTNMLNPVHVADTVPYPWPYNGELAVGELALLICGAQRRLVDLSVGAAEIGARLTGVADLVRRGGGRVIWIRHGNAGR